MPSCFFLIPKRFQGKKLRKVTTLKTSENPRKKRNLTHHLGRRNDPLAFLKIPRDSRCWKCGKAMEESPSPSRRRISWSQNIEHVVFLISWDCLECMSRRHCFDPRWMLVRRQKSKKFLLVQGLLCVLCTEPCLQEISNFRTYWTDP